MSKILNTLQLGRGLAACAVLLFHTNRTLALPKYLGYNPYPFLDYGDSGVNYFFVLSGFVIFLAHAGDLGRAERVPAFFLKRFRRIYPPLWIVLLLVIPILLALHEKMVGPGELISAFLILPAPKEHLLGVEWTLRREILFYLVFALAIWRFRLGLTVAIAWLAVSCVLPFYQFENYLWSFVFSQYNALFAFGVAACALFKSSLRTPGWLLAAGGAGVFTATWCVLALTSIDRNYVSDLLFGLGSAMMILGLAELERRGRIGVPRGLAFLGEASYSIYLVHFFPISAMCKVVTAIGRKMYLPLPVGFLMVASVALCLGILFHLLVEKRIGAALSPAVGGLGMHRAERPA